MAATHMERALRVTTTPPEGTRKTYLLGAGAQKAGTTWLYSYLRRSPQFAHGYFKEYHVFDCIDVELQEWNRRKVFRLASEEADKALEGTRAQPRMLHRASMVLKPQYYFDYFAAMLARPGGIRLVADMTPDYALLSARRFKAIKSSFSDRGIRTAAVFLMRDPVERTYSQIRMQAGRDPERFPHTARDMLPLVHDQDIYAERSRYERTIDALDSVFSPQDVHYAFYEELFRDDTVGAICEFAGIDPIRPDFDDHRNVSAVSTGPALSDDVVSIVASHLRPTYEAVAERFPDKDLTALWPSAKFVL